jgi:peroxiredoxin
LRKVYKEYGPTGLQVIGVAVDDDARTLLPDFIDRFRLEFPVGTAPREQAYAFLDRTNRSVPFSLPLLVLIDRQGMVSDRFSGADDFFAEGQEEKNVRALIEPMLRTGGGRKTGR